MNRFYLCNKYTVGIFNIIEMSPSRAPYKMFKVTSICIHPSVTWMTFKKISLCTSFNLKKLKIDQSITYIQCSIWQFLNTFISFSLSIQYITLMYGRTVNASHLNIEISINIPWNKFPLLNKSQKSRHIAGIKISLFVWPVGLNA